MNKKKSITMLLNGIIYCIICFSILAFFRNYNIVSLLNDDMRNVNKVYVSMYDLFNSNDMKEMDLSIIQNIEKIDSVINIYPFYYLNLEEEGISYSLNDIQINDVAKQYFLAYYPEDNLDDNLKEMYINAEMALTHQLVHTDNGKTYMWLDDIELDIQKENHIFEFTITNYITDYKFMLDPSTNVILAPYTVCENYISNNGVYVIYTNGDDIEKDIREVNAELFVYSFSDSQSNINLQNQYVIKMVVSVIVILVAVGIRVSLYKKREKI